MPSHNKQECQGKKPRDPQTRTRLERMSISRPLIKSSSQQCVIRVPADSRTPTPNDSPSNTTIINDIKYCTSDTCRNSSSCIKTLPKYCPYGNKKESDTSVCPGTCGQPEDGNELDVVNYRHSTMSLGESIAKSLQNLTSGCPAAKKSSAPRSSLSRAPLSSAENERDIRKACFPTSNSRQSMQIPNPEYSEHYTEGELPSRKASCCPDVDSDGDDAAVGRLSREQICPSVKAYLDKQTSAHEINKENVTTQKSFSRTIPTEPALNRTTSTKRGVKPTNSTQAAASEELKSPMSTCTAVESGHKILSQLPCSAQSEQVNHYEDLGIQSSNSQRTSCCTYNQQKSVGRDTEQEHCNNARKISLVTRRSQLSEETDSVQCFPLDEPKKINRMRPCAEENYTCCKSSTSKSAIALNQEKLTKPGPGCNKPSCGMTMCAPRSNVKCASDNELPKSSTNLTSPPLKNAGQSMDFKPQNVGVSSNNCTSALCPGKEIKAQCDCRYPPAFGQFGCTGNLAGNCVCANKNINN